jgi:hypothetical protein
MSQMGQTRKYSHRAYVFRFTQSRHPGQYAVQHLADIAVRLWATRPIVIANVIGAKDKAGLKLKSRLRAALSYLRSSASI